MSRNAYIKGAILIMGLITLHFVGILRPGESLLVRPVNEAGYQLRKLTLSLTKEDGAYETKSPEILLLQAEKDVLTAENQALRELLLFRERESHTLLMARIVASSPDPGRNMLILDRGRADGVTVGSGVVADNGIYVGKIQSVQEQSSTLLLPNDSRSKILASFFAEKHKVKGMVQGQFQLGLELSFVPISEKIEKGMVITTSGREKGIPAGLIIGSLADIRTKPTDLFQFAALAPPVNYDTLTVVSIIIPK